MPLGMGARTVALAGLLAGAALGACGGSQGDAASQAEQADAQRSAGSIGPGSSAGTASVNPKTQSTKTEIDSTPDLRPNAGPGSD